MATALEAIHSVPISVVHLGWRPGLEPDPQGFGVLVPARERRRVLGIIFVSSAYPFRAPGGGTLLTTLVGGAHGAEWAALPDAELVGVVEGFGGLDAELGDFAEVFARVGRVLCGQGNDR